MMIHFYKELVNHKIQLEKNIQVYDQLYGSPLYELLTDEKAFCLDIFKDYWNNDQKTTQYQWFLDYLQEECDIAHKLGQYLYNKYKINKYVQYDS